MFVELRREDNPRGLFLGMHRGGKLVFNGSLWLATDHNFVMEDEVTVKLLKGNQALRDQSGEDTFQLRLGFNYRMLAFPRTTILFRTPRHPFATEDKSALQAVIRAPRDVIIEREAVFWRNQ